MTDFFSGLHSDERLGVYFGSLTCFAGLVIWLTLQWRLHRRTEMEVALKQQMLDQGMPAADIEKVLRASVATPPPPPPPAPSRKWFGAK